MYHLSKERARYKKQKQKKNLTQFLNSLNKGVCLDIFKKNNRYVVLLFYCCTVLWVAKLVGYLYALLGR